LELQYKSEIESQHNGLDQTIKFLCR